MHTARLRVVGGGGGVTNSQVGGGGVDVLTWSWGGPVEQNEWHACKNITFASLRGR